MNWIENRRIRRLSACAAAAGLLLAGCSGASTGSGDQPRPSVQVGSLALAPCGDESLAAGPQDAPVSAGGASPAAGLTQEGTGRPEPHRFCGVIAGGPDGRRLAVTLLSSDPHPRLDNRELLVWHPGGPGISPAEILLAEGAPADLDRFLVVAWDGVAASTADGACGPSSSSFGVDRPLAGLAQLAAAAGRECADKIAGRGDAPSGGAGAAAEGAAELDRLRLALGAEQVTLLTHSYGTAIAEQYLRLHPQRVRAAVLDAPMTLALPWSDRVSVTGGVTAAVVARMLAGCRVPDCPASVLTTGPAASGRLRPIPDVPPARTRARGRPWLVLLVAAAVSSVIETVQFVALSRVAAVDDVVLNVVGALIGVGIGLLVSVSSSWDRRTASAGPQERRWR